MTPWEQWVEAFLSELKPRSSPRSLELWTQRLESFVRYCAEHQVETDVGPWHVEEFQQALVWNPGPKGRLYAPNTVYQAMRMVRVFLRWAAAHGHIPRNPTRGLVLSRPPNRPVQRLSAAEAERVLEAPPQSPCGWRDRAVLETLVGTALSLLALRDLDVGHVDLDRGRIYRAQGPELVLSARLIVALDRYLRWGRPHLPDDLDPEALFLSTRGARLSERAISTMVRRYACQAGQPYTTARILSHSGQALEADFMRGRLVDKALWTSPD